MGGIGSGGARPGSGRKKKSVHLKLAHGTATVADRLQAQDASAAAPEVEIPKDLEPEQVELWKRLAPRAIEQRTLTPATVDAFRLLCRQMSLEHKYLEQLELDGFTIETPLGTKAHPLVGHHRSMMQRVEAGMVRFRLSPIGKELHTSAAAAKPVNKLKALRGGRA